MSGLDLGAGIITLSVSTGTLIALAKLIISKLRKRHKFKERKDYVDKKLKKFWIRKITIEIEGISKSIKTSSELSKFTDIINDAIIAFKNRDEVK